MYLLVGHLNFAGGATPAGGVFSHRLAEATAGVKSSNHFIRLTKSLKEAWGCGNYVWK